MNRDVDNANLHLPPLDAPDAPDLPEYSPGQMLWCLVFVPRMDRAPSVSLLPCYFREWGERAAGSNLDDSGEFDALDDICSEWVGVCKIQKERGAAVIRVPAADLFPTLEKAKKELYARLDKCGHDMRKEVVRLEGEAQAMLEDSAHLVEMAIRIAETLEANPVG